MSPERHREQDRGPDPDYAESSALLRRIIREELSTREPVSVNYHEASGNGEKTLLKWVLTVTGALFVAFVGGSVVGYGQIESMRAEFAAKFADQQRQLDRLTEQSNKVYRGVANESADARRDAGSFQAR